MGLLDDLKNKDVVLRMRDSPKIFGVLVSYDTDFYVLRFLDGINHNIPRSEVLDIHLDPRA
jgi:hypothetical protein